MQLILIPLDNALPTLQARLDSRVSESLGPAEEQAVAELLERCIRTGEVLVAFALHVGGRPSSN